MDRFRYALRKLATSTDEVVSLAAARHNCAADGDEHDQALIEILAQSRTFVEERTDCSLLSTTWEMTFDQFPRSKKLYLPKWPLQSLVAVHYVDANGDSQTIDVDEFSIRLDDSGRGRIARKNYAPWPSTAITPDAVRIEFIAGWDSPEKVPPTWSRAILMLTAWWLEQREAGVLGISAVDAPIGVKDLIDSASTADDFGEFDLCDD